jgi:hypothetical protein
MQSHVPREEFQHFILPDSLRSAKHFIVNMCASGDFLSSFFVALCGLDSEGTGNLFGRDSSLVEWFSVSIQNATAPESGSLPLLQLGLALMELAGRSAAGSRFAPEQAIHPVIRPQRGKPNRQKPCFRSVARRFPLNSRSRGAPAIGFATDSEPFACF